MLTTGYRMSRRSETRVNPPCLLLNSYQRGHFSSLTPREAPWGLVRVDPRWFSYRHTAEVMSLQSSFRFYGPWGTVCVVCRTGVTVHTERTRESSDWTHVCKWNTSHIHVHLLGHYWQNKWFQLLVIYLFSCDIRLRCSRIRFLLPSLQFNTTLFVLLEFRVILMELHYEAVRDPLQMYCWEYYTFQINHLRQLVVLDTIPLL